MSEVQKHLYWSLTSLWMSWNLKNIFLWFLKASWIARMSETSLLKFSNYWNVLESSKYFSMTFKSLLDCQRVRNIFTEVWQVLECLGIFKIFFYDFQKPLGLPEGQTHLFWSLTSPGMSQKLQNIFQWFLKAPWIVRSSETSLLKFDKSWNVLESSKYFSMISKSLLDCQRVRNIFNEVCKVLECLEIFKIFFYDF